MTCVTTFSYWIYVWCLEGKTEKFKLISKVKYLNANKCYIFNNETPELYSLEDWLRRIGFGKGYYTYVSQCEQYVNNYSDDESDE